MESSNSKFYVTVHSLKGSLENCFAPESIFRLQLQCGWESYQAKNTPTIRSAIWNEVFEFKISSFDDLDISVFVGTSKTSFDEVFIGHTIVTVPSLGGYDYSAKWYTVEQAKSWENSGGFKNRSNASSSGSLAIFLSVSLDPHVDFFSLSLDNQIRNVAKPNDSNLLHNRPVSGSQRSTIVDKSLLARDQWVKNLNPKKELSDVWNSPSVDQLLGASQLCWVIGVLQHKKLTKAYYRWKYFIRMKRVVIQYIESGRISNSGSVPSLNANKLSIDTFESSVDSSDIPNLSQQELHNLLQQKVRIRAKLDEDILQLRQQLEIQVAEETKEADGDQEGGIAVSSPSKSNGRPHRPRSAGINRVGRGNRPPANKNSQTLKRSSVTDSASAFIGSLSPRSGSMGGSDGFAVSRASTLRPSARFSTAVTGQHIRTASFDGGGPHSSPFQSNFSSPAITPDYHRKTIQLSGRLKSVLSSNGLSDAAAPVSDSAASQPTEPPVTGASSDQPSDSIGIAVQTNVDAGVATRRDSSELSNPSPLTRQSSKNSSGTQSKISSVTEREKSKKPVTGEEASQRMIRSQSAKTSRGPASVSSPASPMIPSPNTTATSASHKKKFSPPPSTLQGVQTNSNYSTPNSHLQQQQQQQPPYMVQTNIAQNLFQNSSPGNGPLPMSPLHNDTNIDSISDPLERACILLKQACLSVSSEDSHDNYTNDSSRQSDCNVRVAIRMRPLNPREREHHASICVNMHGSEVTVREKTTLRASGDRLTPSADERDRDGLEKTFAFDYCFDAEDNRASSPVAGSQQKVFERLGIEVLSNTWKGYNASLFAYGQTGSGKSFSMMGSNEEPGIIPRICELLFYMIEKQGESTAFTVEASYLEIYNENIRDLLNPKQTNLKVREHPVTGVFVENLSSCAVLSYKDIEDLLAMGLHHRTTAATNMNASSSRSHAVFTITIRSEQTLEASENKKTRCCKLCLVDLAGSERAQATGASGARLREGANINKSLSTLGRCISALAKVSKKGSQGQGNKSSVIPYRDSVLTTILRESLCGNAKTAMLATISPADDSLGETMSTLRYAHSAKQIVTKPTIIEEDPTTKIISNLRDEVLRLREMLQVATDESSQLDRPGSVDIEQNLLRAEAALKLTGSMWSSKLESLQDLKNRLKKQQRVASLGTVDLTESEQAETPYLVSLSNDPSLNLAVKVYLPKNQSLLIGRLPRQGDNSKMEELVEPDLQLDGIGIESLHCTLVRESDAVYLRIPFGSVTYLNGTRRDPSFLSVDKRKSRELFSMEVNSTRERTVSDILETVGQGHDNISYWNDLDLNPSSHLMKPDGLHVETVSVKLNNGDRIILGACSHIFAFMDPMSSNNDTTVLTHANRNEISKSEDPKIFGTRPPTYQLAIRELVLGREETEGERKDRLARKIVNMLRAPYYRRIFEDNLIEGLKALREANTIVSRLSPYTGLTFEASLCTDLNISVLSSLTIRDLFTFNAISIRIRCSRSLLISHSDTYFNPLQRFYQSIPDDENGNNDDDDDNISSATGSIAATDSSGYLLSTGYFKDETNELTGIANNVDDIDEANYYTENMGEFTLELFYDSMMLLRSLFAHTLTLRAYLDRCWLKIRRVDALFAGSRSRSDEGPAQESIESPSNAISFQREYRMTIEQLADDVFEIIRLASVSSSDVLSPTTSALIRPHSKASDSVNSDLDGDSSKDAKLHVNVDCDMQSEDCDTNAIVDGDFQCLKSELKQQYDLIYSIGQNICVLNLDGNLFFSRFSTFYRNDLSSSRGDEMFTINVENQGGNQNSNREIVIYRSVLCALELVYDEAILRCFPVHVLNQF